VVGLLTLLSMGRAWADGFWKPSPAEVKDMAAPGTPLLIAIAGLSAVTVAITFGAGPLFDVTSRAAQQLLHRDEYIRTVLGGMP